MAGIIGKKIGMTSVFSVEGKNVPCTVIEAGPCVVTQVKTKEKEGYDALQLAYGDKKDLYEGNHHQKYRDRKLMFPFFMKMIMLMLLEFQKEKDFRV